MGDIYIYENDTVTAGVPQTASKIHLKINAGDNQSFKCATTFSHVDYAFITSLTVGVQKKTAATVDFRLEKRLVGGLFRPLVVLTSASGGNASETLEFRPFLQIEPDSDVRVVGTASTTNVEVDASFSAILASVV